MSVTPIRLFGDPVLRTPAAPVVDFDAELRRLVADLTETMFAAGGAGLAAPQIGVGLRVFTWYVDGEVGHLVNPDVDAGRRGDRGGRPRAACRSRASASTAAATCTWSATGWNMHGDPVRVEGSELLARAIQHETDHLDGVLFVDRLDAEARAAALAELDGGRVGGHGRVPAGARAGREGEPPLRLLFAGTPAPAVPSLEALLASGHEVVAVLTRPDARVRPRPAR